jgi:hypothetical protein
MKRRSPMMELEMEPTGRYKGRTYFGQISDIIASPKLVLS